MKKKSALKRGLPKSDPRILFATCLIFLLTLLMVVFKGFSKEGPGDGVEVKNTDTCFSFEIEKSGKDTYYVVSQAEGCEVEQFTVLVYLSSGKDRLTETVIGPRISILANEHDLWLRVIYQDKNGVVVNEPHKL